MPIAINEGPIHIWTNDIEPQAFDQLRNIAKLPIIYPHIAVMPDVHWGMGATVGSVIVCRGAVIPAAVGVDIGCGMMAVRTSLSAHMLPDSLLKIRHEIERAVPVGFGMHSECQPTCGLDGPLRWLQDKYPGITQREPDKVWKQIGTLGGGNHFIELCLDQNDNVWIMLHSGSRNIGKTIADVFIELAKKQAETRDFVLPDRDLAWLADGTSEYADYVTAVLWAQEYAMINRKSMMEAVIGVLRKHFDMMAYIESINCHHNYVSVEEHFGEMLIVTRKGAIRAGVGDRGIIPGSMGTRSYIVEGLGNPQSLCSCSHGAGRAMSRGQANRTFNIDDVLSQLEGIECRKDTGIIDELPSAYKDIDTVMANSSDLVRTDYVLKQVLCVKG